MSVTDSENMQNFDSDQSTITSNFSSLSRRRFTAIFTLATTSLILGVNKAHAGLFYSTKPVSGIPSAWVKEKGNDILRYANYIKGLKLSNITPYMVIKPHFKKRGRISNEIPPRYMWKRIGATLKVIDRLAYELNSPVKELLSVYRSPRYNRSCGGKSRSQHMENRAIDVKFSRASSYAAARKAKQMRDKGWFKGGLGTYSSFMHIDTRGSNATW